MNISSLKTMVRRRKQGFIAAALMIVLLAVLAHWWVPLLIKTLYQTGITSPIEVGGVQLKMDDSWFPMRSSERGLWKLAAKQPTIVLSKSEKYPFQESYPLVAVSRVSPDEASILRKDGPHRVDKKTYPWGTAALLVGRKGVFIDEYGIVITVTDASESYLWSALNDIVAITADRGPKGSE